MCLFDWGFHLSKILIVFEDDQLRHYYDSLSHSIGDAEITQFNNISDAMTYLGKESTNLIISGFENEGIEKLIQLAQGSDKSTPVILTYFQENEKKAKKTFKSQSLIHYSAHGEEADTLWTKMEKLLSLSARANSKKKYCRVALSFFYSVKEVFCDVYLQINEEKYVKVLNRYEDVDFEDLKRYENKNVKHLFVRDRDFELITKKLVQQIRPMFNEEGNPNEGALMVAENPTLGVLFPIQLQETVTETIQQVGINDEAVEMTNYAINSTLTLVEKNPEIYSVLQNSIKGSNYISEISFMLSYLTCAVCNETPWKGEESNLNLTVASFFHDVGISDPELAKVHSINTAEFNNLGYSEQDIVRGHVDKSVQTINQIEGLPGKVSTIIAQHHEQFDGSGFPKGLNYKRIFPLSALFNLCQELAVFIYETQATKEGIHEVVGDFAKLYDKGNYKIVVQAMQKVFDVPQVTCGTNHKIAG